jgi:Cft2 family RNA processing exonuclease
MMSENTAAHTLAQRMIGEPNQAIFFVGYTDPDSPGGRLKAAPQGESFLLSASGGQVTKLCESEEFDLTAHANRDELLDFVARVEPRAVFLGHGEEDSRNWFEGEIRMRHPNIQIIQPTPGGAVRV